MLYFLFFFLLEVSVCNGANTSKLNQEDVQLNSLRGRQEDPMEHTPRVPEIEEGGVYSAFLPTPSLDVIPFYEFPGFQTMELPRQNHDSILDSVLTGRPETLRTSPLSSELTATVIPTNNVTPQQNQPEDEDINQLTDLFDSMAETEEKPDWEESSEERQDARAQSSANNRMQDDINEVSGSMSEDEDPEEDENMAG